MDHAVLKATTLLNATWRTSTYTNDNNQCVEVASLPTAVAVRDSKIPVGPALLFGTAAFAQCVGSIATEVSVT
ncbi:DUF397 domain-containing protein [Embleya sp. AB8]|uniref:DUF397 domain-containing protein n=1 Tax=Embleya sp. AB8 TaxID=3156304 RepID=UPI003C718DCA